MPTHHINAKEGDIAKVVLMPGDPIRAKWITETYLHDYIQVNDVRGMLTFTGYTKNNKRISVMASGMGIPSIGIYSHELFNNYDVDVIIRVGTCGTYQPEVNLKDVIIAVGSSTDSNWLSQDQLCGTFSALADFSLACSAKEVAEAKGLAYHAGNILSADVFYDSNPDNWKKWAKLGVLGVEMESYALYVNALRAKKKALCLLTVTDSFVNRNQFLTIEERAKGLSTMIELAIDVAERYS